MRRLAIIGAGGHGKVVADMAFVLGWQDVTFFDGAWPAKSMNGRWPIVGDTNVFLAGRDAFDGVVIAIGSCDARKSEFDRVKEAGTRVLCLIHPTAAVSRFADLGEGSVVLAGAVVNADARLGVACIVNVCATVDHDCVLADAVHVAPGANLSGNVTVGSGAWIGVGAAVRQGIQIGRGVMVGAGAVVIKDIPDGATVVGNPAQIRDR